eukprot:9146140-Prorocentrum_lima.AAC.1
MDPRAPYLAIREIQLQIRLERHLAPAEVGYERAMRIGYATRLAGLGRLTNSSDGPMCKIWQID